MVKQSFYEMCADYTCRFLPLGRGVVGRISDWVLGVFIGNVSEGGTRFTWGIVFFPDLGRV